MPNYPPESAGRILVKNVPTALLGETILEVRKRLFGKVAEYETINYIYVLDQQGKLVGVFSIKDALQKADEAKVDEFTAKEMVKVRPRTDRERVAILALRHNLKSVPVADKDNVFLGAVPSDVILEILHTENIEDILRFAGIAKYNTFSEKIFSASSAVLTKLRLPWLVLGLFGGLLAAQIVAFFEGPLKNHFILASFIPLIVYMADAVGTQTETLFIRSLVYRLNLREYVMKEIRVSLFIALILGLLLGLVVSLWFGPVYIALILGVSLFLTVVTAFLMGLLVPYFLQKMEKDPAVGSGPLGTIIRDVLSLIIYFSVASLMIGLF